MDLGSGQLVQITSADDPAGPPRRVDVTWSIPGTVTKVDDESITIRPTPRIRLTPQQLRPL
jgi:hypothetical protein